METTLLKRLAGRVDGRDECGQSLVEYSLILLFIPLVVVVVLPSVGVDVVAAFQDVADALI